MTRQCALMPDTKPLEEGLSEAFAWYRQNQDQVEKKPFFEYIDKYLK